MKEILKTSLQVFYKLMLGIILIATFVFPVVYMVMTESVIAYIICPLILLYMISLFAAILIHKI